MEDRDVGKDTQPLVMAVPGAASFVSLLCLNPPPPLDLHQLCFSSKLHYLSHHPHHDFPTELAGSAIPILHTTVE